MTRYTPETAFKAWVKAHRQPVPKASLKQLVNRAGEVLQSQPVEPEGPKIPLLCFPLRAFVNRSPGLPDDFTNIERTGAALKSYVRPDGSVFLGLFEMPRHPDSGIVVFGPPGTTSEVAVAVSQQYRRDENPEAYAMQSGMDEARRTLTSSVS